MSKVIHMKRTSGKMRYFWRFFVTAVFGFLYYYLALPALNIHASEFYVFLILLCLVFTGMVVFTSKPPQSSEGAILSQAWKLSKLPLLLAGVILLASILGWLSSLVLFRARAYSELLVPEEGDFTEDVDQISYDQIPMLDEDSAAQLGERTLGELSDMVSQFEVSGEYAQINYQDTPVRVTYLYYADLIKWLINRKEGLPAYIVIDMVTQEATIVRLDEGMKYSPSEHFGRYLERYLRFQYPTTMFSDINFEIDEDGNPWWICSVLEKTIGLFGGDDVCGAVLVNAVTGEHIYYDAEDVPSWVDRVYDADLIIQQYDYHGVYQNGYFNSLFGQKNVTVTTDNYNYITLDDDVWLYTGITSVTSDESNIGFILVNQRTKEAKYYSISGAEESSAMSSAEGVVQHLDYSATFPLLLNISGQPTYFMALKDNADLVKMYAMVNVQQYQIVATGSTVAECEQTYNELLVENDLDAVILEDTGGSAAYTVSGVVAELRSAVLDGTTYYYIRLEDDDTFYRVSAADWEVAVILSVGDSVTITVEETGTSILSADELLIS